MSPGYNWRPRQWGRIDRRKAWNRRLVAADSAAVAAAVPGRSVAARLAPYQQSIYRSNRGTEFWIADEGTRQTKGRKVTGTDMGCWMTGTAAADEQGVLHTDRRQETHTGMERDVSPHSTALPIGCISPPHSCNSPLPLCRPRPSPLRCVFFLLCGSIWNYNNWMKSRKNYCKF